MRPVDGAKIVVGNWLIRLVLDLSWLVDLNHVVPSCCHVIGWVLSKIAFLSYIIFMLIYQIMFVSSCSWTRHDASVQPHQHKAPFFDFCLDFCFFLSFCLGSVLIFFGGALFASFSSGWATTTGSSLVPVESKCNAFFSRTQRVIMLIVHKCYI